MNQDGKARVPISKYTHKLTNKPPVVAATTQEWLEKEIKKLNNMSETYNNRRFVPLAL